MYFYFFSTDHLMTPGNHKKKPTFELFSIQRKSSALSNTSSYVSIVTQTNDLSAVKTLYHVPEEGGIALIIESVGGTTCLIT